MKRVAARALDALRTFAILTLGVAATGYLYTWWGAYVDRIETTKEQHVHQVIGQPFIHHGDKVENTTAQPGDLIFVHNKYIRTERCSMAVANLLINPETNDVHHWSTFQNWLPAGTFTADEMFKIPEWMPPATYRLVKRTTATCDGKTVYFVNFDLMLTIRPR
ncbi:hypothetical protein LNAOJCKE_0430 [Methylorubrum aminovorans]|uniref:Uncharacterized protein n=1 Tax=Methylorubrum aminovorans TaxID=269069 RepID=A0ABQ4U7E7_9HYPH|nr:hypothetical protein [Methylorubrum aminovorans]GJE63236.1 hypothetical protein LNAOJCKE_0430 [Methylorubrum aminovorans]GMA79281.1 hypothetical protein GCM10025880_56980 [Methylorubrum aminovorans]